jgi:hypothetical protein
LLREKRARSSWLQKRRFWLQSEQGRTNGVGDYARPDRETLLLERLIPYGVESSKSGGV